MRVPGNWGLLLLCVGMTTPSVPLAAQQGEVCMKNEAYRLFDFWMGEWEVFVFNNPGRKAGENRIERAERGCVLTESWESVRGTTGRSINYYDPADGKWHQLWVDPGGTVIEISGGFENGAMTLVGRITTADGTTKPFKGVWTPLEDGSVRQRFEQSNDGGKTWTVWFDGRYVRKQ